MTDRVKENLFNILSDWVEGTIWLDLFAGTGQVGIEALSRGAGQVVFVDTAPAALKTIHSNLKVTGLIGLATVIKQDAFDYLNSDPNLLFDVVFVAPPQYHGIWKDVLQEFDDKHNALLSDRGMIVVQIDPKEFISLTLNNLRQFDSRKYGNTMLCFYELFDSMNT